MMLVVGPDDHEFLANHAKTGKYLVAETLTVKGHDIRPLTGGLHVDGAAQLDRDPS